jgi:hypothetical protein
MAAFMSNYTIDALIAWRRGTTFPVVPANIFAAAFTVKPAADGTGGTEVTGGSYARVQIATAAGSWTAPATVSTNRQTKNNTAVNFVTATANWGTVVGIGWYDASSAGNLLWYEDLTSSQTVNNGFQLTFPVNNLQDNWNNA